MKKTLHHNGHRWTIAELKKLMALWANKEELNDIADTLNVSRYAVLKQIQRLRKEGVPLERRTRGHISGRHNRPWTQAEVEYLIRRRSERATYEEVGNDLGRTYNAVCGMINKLRKENVPVVMMGSGVRRLWDVESLKASAVCRAELSEFPSRKLA